MSTLDVPIWIKYSIALTCCARSHFQRTLCKERWVQGWDERYRSPREGDEEGQKKEETGDRFWKSCVLSFCGRSGGSMAKKWFQESARGN